MNSKFLIFSTIAVVLSFIGGFFLANALNRSEISDLKSEISKYKGSQQAVEESGNENVLTDEEISQKIEEADSKPENIDYQKDLAIGLYRYATMKQEVKWLPDVARMMTRVYEKNPKDFNTAAVLGSIYFDIGTGKSDNESLKKAREFYQKALEIKPKEIEVQTDLGVTYLFSTPPEPDKAIVEFQKSLQINPKHEKTLQNMIQAKIATGKVSEAEGFLQKLKEVNPKNEAISELTEKIEQTKTKK
ncbi:MAG TPA: tetratricopeptide repeat protein [Pyrinomonadaceae bacterium]|nr:tetratricopeptide repeat protein [Pyrinomonadaceae bacterium]